MKSSFAIFSHMILCVLKCRGYAVFLSEDALGSNRSLLGYADGALTSSFQMPPETPVQTLPG